MARTPKFLTGQPPTMIRCRGLTLIELLVVITILGALATGAVPSVRLLLAHASSEDVASRLKISWQLAQAMAQAQGTPVVWNAATGDDSLQISIASAHGDTLWSMSLRVHSPQIFLGDSPEKEAHLVIYSHGLTGHVKVAWDANGKNQAVALGTMDDEVAASTTKASPAE